MVPKLTLFGNDISQPSRAVRFFLRMNQIPHDFELIRVEKLENRSPEHLKRNPHGKIPTIRIDFEEEHKEPFLLSESIAIIKFLQSFYRDSLKYALLPPNDIFIQSRVESYLHSHHETTRRACANYYQTHYLFPMMGLPNSLEDVKRSEKRITPCLNYISEHLLTDDSYICKLDTPTIADLMVYEEIAQLNMFPELQISNNYPRISVWMKKIEKLPGYNETHELLYKFLKQKLSKI